MCWRGADSNRGMACGIVKYCIISRMRTFVRNFKDNPIQSIIGAVFICAVVVIIISIIMFLIGVLGKKSQKENQKWGATFSISYAEFLGLDWRSAFQELTEDMGITRYRIPVYWDRIEKVKGKFEWHELDWLMDYADKQHLFITLAIGQRVPRWPECHMPKWTAVQSDDDRMEAVRQMMKQVIVRYGDRTSLERWQVENEPFLRVFGNCPKMTKQQLRLEIMQVRSLSPLPIVVTDSGELSSWIDIAPYPDYVGVSVYRLVRNDLIGYFQHPWTPAFYQAKASLLGNKVQGVFISELQMEPWGSKSLNELSLPEQLKTMDINRARDNIAFANSIGFKEVYVWGVEWWYFLKMKHSYSEFWDMGKELFHSTRGERVI